MIQAAKILEQRSHLVPGKLRITEHFFQVPRDYSNPSLGTIQLFARSARKLAKPADYTTPEDPAKSQLPWLLYLQGGPGCECSPPQDMKWSGFLLDRGYHVISMDQRGTGLSTGISQSSLQLRGDEKVQAEYMKHFRADNIVRDAEAIRKALTADYPEEKKKWSIIGQSFGGFCSVSYLSLFPEGLKESFIFGGLPPLTGGPDQVYDRYVNLFIDLNPQWKIHHSTNTVNLQTVPAAREAEPGVLRQVPRRCRQGAPDRQAAQPLRRRDSACSGR